VSDLAKRLRDSTEWFHCDCEIKMKCADRLEELEAVLQEVAAWVEGLGYYADEGAILVPIFKKVEAVLGKGYT
jgi:hypothetical protein